MAPLPLNGPLWLTKRSSLLTPGRIPGRALAENHFQHFLQLAERLVQLQQQAETLVPQSPAAVLTTVPGIGAYLAAQYLAYVVDPQRFNHADQIWSLAGFDVQQDDSGDRRRMGRITRRGDPAFRTMLFAIGLNTSQYRPAIAHSPKARSQAW